MSGRWTDPELPWGNWLRLDQAKGVFVDDVTGERWTSLREALWEGDLHLASPRREPSPELMETITAVLAAAVRRSASYDEQLEELFQGNRLYRDLMNVLLAGHGLIEVTEAYSVKQITPKGLTVLATLMATRPHTVAQGRPGGATIAQLAELGLGPEGREERLARVEAAAKGAGWSAAFLRGREAGRPTIVLSKRGDGPVPVMKTVWTLRFGTKEQRDRFHDWLCHRLDRWPAWGDMASKYGADELTHHLLQVLASETVDREANMPSAAVLPGG